MKRCLFLLLACLFAVSCGDDPMTHSGVYTPPSYEPTVESLNGSFNTVCGTGETDLYAIGSLIMHYDGNAWSPVEPPSGNFVNIAYSVGFETGELIVGNYREVWLYNDGSWTELPDPPGFLETLDGVAPDDLYGLTDVALVHYDGTDWTPVPIGAEPQNLNAIDVTETGLTAVGWQGRIDRLRDGVWSSVHIDSTVGYQSVAVTPTGRIFVADYYDIWEIVGSSAATLSDDELVEPMLCADGDVLYAAGRDPAMFDRHIITRYSAGSWANVEASNGRLRDFWVGRGEIAAAGDNAFLWHVNSSGTETEAPAPNRDRFNDAVAIGDAIYTIGTSSYRYQDGVWTNLDKEYITRIPAEQIDGRFENDIYAVADQMILHYNGNAWSWVNAGLGCWVHAVCVLPDGDVVAAGDDPDPIILEFDGTTWTKRPVPLNFHTFWEITTVGDLVVAVGDNGYIGMRRGTHWTLVRPTSHDLVSVWGYDERHIYAASVARNEICVYDGFEWDVTYIEGPTLNNMRSIWGTSLSNIFVLDYTGLLVRFDGKQWIEEKRVFTDNMQNVSGTRRELMIVGPPGAAVYRR